MTDKELIDKTNETISELVYDKTKLQKAYNYYNGKEIRNSFVIQKKILVQEVPLLLNLHLY